MVLAMTTNYALITGATSGIGYELARLFAAAGKPLILVARLEDRLAAVKAELTAAHGVEVDTIAVDLFTPDGAGEVIRRVQAAGRVVDVLVNNAGQGEWGLFAETDLRRQLDIIHLNVVVLVTLTRHFMADMLARGEGKILQLGSVFSKIPAPYMSVYAATKAFVLSFGEALINELKDTRVTMTVLMPGATDTDFFHKAGAVHTRVYGESPLSNPADVARDGYDALMSGKSSIVSGLRNKLQTTVADLLPLTVDAAIARAVNEPITPGEHARTEATHEASRRERAALDGD
jgi:short-subunit dehydrogenase